MQRSLAPFVLLLLALALPASVPAVDLPTAARSKDALTPAAKPEPDAGAKDPSDFPRPPGLVRTTYSQAAGSIRDMEIATYHTGAGMDGTAAQYLERLQAANWKKGSDEVSGSDIHRVRIVEWTTPAKEAELRFYVVRGGGTDVRVRIFTYKTTSPKVAVATANGAATLPTATPAQANASHAAAKSKAMGAAPLGPPPTDIRIGKASGDSAAYTIGWSYSRDYTGADVYVDSPNGWIALAENESTALVFDHAFVPPNTQYTVVLHYADGSVGSATYTWANPPQPGVATGITATQAGPGQIHVTWNQPPGTGSVRVFVSGLDPAGQLAGGGTADFANVSVGTHTVRVASRYGGRNGTEILGPEDAPASVTVQAEGTDFRIILLGVQCVHETNDDPLQLDGKRDEIFAGVYVTTVPPLPPNATSPPNRNPHQNQGGPRGWHRSAIPWMMPAPGTLLQTKVMGDTNGFPDRVRAGSASDKGGIQTGDYVPDASIAAPKPGVTVYNDRFPLLVWQGPITPDKDYLVIAPVLFEWDNPKADAWNLWSQWWTTDWGSEELGLAIARLSRSAPPFEILSQTHLMDPDDDGNRPPPQYYAPWFQATATRPIGLEDQNPKAGPFAEADLGMIPRGFVLTRANIDAVLGGDQLAVVLQEDFTDGGGKPTSASLGGHYILYLQIERVAAATAVRP